MPAVFILFFFWNDCCRSVSLIDLTFKYEENKEDADFPEAEDIESDIEFPQKADKMNSIK